MDRGMQERRVSLLVAGEVRAADRPNEDCVSREDEPRFGASSRSSQGTMFWFSRKGMSGRSGA